MIGLYLDRVLHKVSIPFVAFERDMCFLKSRCVMRKRIEWGRFALEGSPFLFALKMSRGSRLEVLVPSEHYRKGGGLESDILRLELGGVYHVEAFTPLRNRYD